MTGLAIRDEQHYLDVVREVRTLAERCDTVESAKDLADRATAAKVYAARAKLGGDMVNRAAAAKLWAERRAGELIAADPDIAPGKGHGVRPLEALGLTKAQSSRWQQLAQIPADQFADAVEEAREQGVVSAAKVSAIADRKRKRVTSNPKPGLSLKKAAREVISRSRRVGRHYEVPLAAMTSLMLAAGERN